MSFLLVLLLQFPTFERPVGINGEQIALLQREAEALVTHTVQSRKQFMQAETQPALNVRRDALSRGISTATELVNRTKMAFQKLSTGDQQNQATQIFFGSIQDRYRQLSSDAERLQFADYGRVRDRVLGTFEGNVAIYRIVAKSKSMSFDLNVESKPQEAAISYKRTGDPYKYHAKPTNSVVENLVYAVWRIRVQLSGYQDDEKDYDPWTQSDRTIRFELKRK